MRTGAAAGHDGYFHEAAFYGSDAEFLAITVPFVRDGLASGEPTLVRLDAQWALLLGSALGDLDGVTFMPAADRYARPTTTIRSYREWLAKHVADGARQVRVVGDVPHPGTGASWDTWVRYEAVINDAYDEFPLWGLCPYDTRTTPADVLADVERLHPHVATTDERHLGNARYEDPAAYLRSRTPSTPFSSPGARPAVTIVDPSPTTARRAVTDLARAERLSTDAVQRLELATSEIAANAVVHGRGPVRLRAWAGPDRITVAVTDGGPGPVDPFVGLVPSTTRPDGVGGYGLWLVHQLCTDVALAATEAGFTVQLTLERADTRT